MERPSQAPPSGLNEPCLHAGAAPPRNVEELRREAVLALLDRVTALRAYSLPVFTLVLLALVLCNPTTERVVASVVWLVVVTGVVSWDLSRRGSPRTWRDFRINLGVSVFMETVLIAVTGMADSPFLVTYAVMAMVFALLLGFVAETLITVAVLSAALWGMVALELGGWLANVAYLFLPPTPLASDVSHVVGKAAVMQVIMIGLCKMGIKLNMIFADTIHSRLQAREDLVHRVQAQNRELVNLSAGIAHELKNPLASIQGLTQMLQKSEDNRERRFEVLLREIARMRRILDDFLNFARPLGELGLRPVDVRELMGALSTLHEGIAAGRGVVLGPPPDGASILLEADPRKLEQALINLVQNAIDASPAGAEVSWVARKAGHEVHLGVADRGPGLATEIVDKVGRPGVTTKSTGSGIGLVVVRAIAEQHGGRLELRPREGGGLEALLVLPEKFKAALEGSPA